MATATERLPLLVDQGSDDEFLDLQLKPELLRAACESAGHPLDLRIQPGYDHSYYFIASFIGEHIAHHARALKGEAGALSARLQPRSQTVRPRRLPIADEAAPTKATG